MYFRGVSSLEKLNKDVKRNAKYLKAFPKVNLKKLDMRKSSSFWEWIKIRNNFQAYF